MTGPIDCDIHPSIPGLDALLPYLPVHWQEMVRVRGVGELNSISYPANAPITARPDWRPGTGKPAASLERIRSECLDRFGSAIAICNCLYGVPLLFSEDLAGVFARAVNEWMVDALLAKDERLRGSIVVPIQSVERSVAEIEHCAADPRFVQILLLAGNEHLLGKRMYWPIYAAAEKHGLAIGIHAGSSYHNPPTGVGWPTFYSEDYIAQSQSFQTQLTSLITEGVFSRYPALRVVLLESGWTWLPAYLWRLTKYWRGLRMEVPWVDRAPGEIVRSNVRFSLQPMDAPPTEQAVDRLLNQLHSDELLLFSTDYPHWQFDEDPIPPHLPPDLVRKIRTDNPRAAYPRLADSAELAGKALAG
jgi:uncharacterized protein